MSKKNLKTKSGFSLIEVLITLLVLSVGIAAVSALMAGNIKTSINTKNQIIAASLAQEATELVRNLKDNNATFLTDIANGSDYRVDYLSDYAAFRNSPAAFAGDANKKLYLNVFGFYSHTNATNTKFYRKIEMANDIVSGNKIATVFVSWNGTGFPSPLNASTCTVGKKCVLMQTVLSSVN